MKPFYAATYIPKEGINSQGNILHILNSIVNLYSKNKNRVIQSANSIDNMIKNYNTQNIKHNDTLKENLIENFIAQVDKAFDKKNHGWGSKPKFPNAPTLESLLDIYTVTQNEKALKLVLKTLKTMASSGVYDQIEGGFYRYSVDEKWLIPHFEKMLYTNAELLSVYTKAYLITKDNFYKDIAEQLIKYTQNRFQYNGLFFSASDADSIVDKKKKEGYYFLFSYDEVIKTFQSKGYSKKRIQEVLKYYNITEKGNFKYKNNLFITSQDKPKDIKNIKEVFKEIRATKKYPFIDKKILTSWNALMITSLFEAGKIDPRYAKLAQNHLDTLLKNIYIDNTLYHQKIHNKSLKELALLEDYSFLITSLLKAYDYSLEKKYLLLADTLTKKSIKKFYKDDKWYMSEDTFQVVSTFNDTAYKNSTANMIDNIFKLSLLTDNYKLNQFAKKNIEQNIRTLNNSSIGISWMLRNYIPFTKGYIVLKGDKSSLKNKTLPAYPFLLKKGNSDSIYLACSIDACFSYSKEYSKVLENIFKKINYPLKNSFNK